MRLAKKKEAASEYHVTPERYGEEIGRWRRATNSDGLKGKGGGGGGGGGGGEGGRRGTVTTN